MPLSDECVRALIAHELGHVWRTYSGATLLNGDGLLDVDNRTRERMSMRNTLDIRSSLHWENAARSPGPYRWHH